MSKLNEAFNQYMELEKENNQIEKDLVAKEEEFSAITREMDHNVSGLFLSQIVNESTYLKTKKYFKTIFPLCLGIIIGGNLLVNFIVSNLMYAIPSIAISLAIFLGYSFNDLKDKFNTIKEYESNEAKLSNYNSGVITRLREIKRLIKIMGEQRELNGKKMKELETEVVQLLALEMQEEYRKQGIEEEIEIDSATITANTKNRLELTFKKDA